MKTIFLFAALVFATQVFAQKSKVNNLEKDFAEMLELFEGEFDNFSQTYKEKEDKVKDAHENIHSIFKKANVPAVGKNTFYVMQYMDGDSTKIYRQRLYNFTLDKTAQAIRLDIYTFKTDSSYYYSNLMPEKLTNITTNDLKGVEGCHVFWKKVNNDFIGYMPKNQCNFISKRSGKKIYATDSLKLNKDEIWIRDEAFDSAGNRIYGRADGVHHKLKRCTFYKGWILLQKAGYDDQYMQMRNITLHNQGKRQRLISEDGKPTKYEVELAEVVYGKDLTVFKIAFYEIGISKAIAYSWASPGSKNIGLNMRWLQAGFTKVE